jgi:hypothetical protein
LTLPTIAARATSRIRDPIVDFSKSIMLTEDSYLATVALTGTERWHSKGEREKTDWKREIKIYINFGKRAESHREGAEDFGEGVKSSWKSREESSYSHREKWGTTHEAGKGGRERRKKVGRNS